MDAIRRDTIDVFCEEQGVKSLLVLFARLRVFRTFLFVKLALVLLSRLPRRSGVGCFAYKLVLEIYLELDAWFLRLSALMSYHEPLNLEVLITNNALILVPTWQTANYCTVQNT